MGDDSCRHLRNGIHHAVLGSAGTPTLDITCVYLFIIFVLTFWILMVSLIMHWLHME